MTSDEGFGNVRRAYATGVGVPGIAKNVEVAIFDNLAPLVEFKEDML